MTGGGGTDIFVFGPVIGHDIITDFDPKSERIQISKSLFADYASITSAMHEVGTDVVITHDANQSITLKNVALASRHSTDFLFL